MERSDSVSDNARPPSPGIGAENLSIEVTTRCTNECSHCFARAGRADEPELEYGTARGIADEGFSIGYRSLHLTGGEPLLWPRLFDLTDHALDAGYKTLFINTNGSLLGPGEARRLAAHGKRITVSVSLQGPEDLHDRVRGPGSFKKAMQGARNVLEAGLSFIIFTTVGTGLVPELPRFAERVFADLAGAQEMVLIQLIRPSREASDPEGELLSPADFCRMVRSAALLNLYGYRMSVLENPLAGVAARAMDMPWLPGTPALHRSGKIVVMADRSITPAHSTREQFGRYSPGMLKTVLASDAYAAAVAPDRETCPGCGFHDACKNGGMVRPSEWFRDMEENDPYCRRVMELIS